MSIMMYNIQLLIFRDISILFFIPWNLYSENNRLLKFIRLQQ